MSPKYAHEAPYHGTKVSASRTREAMLTLLEKWGCTSYGWGRDGNRESLTFLYNDIQYRLDIKPLPTVAGGHSEPARRQAWRALYYRLKSVIETAFWESVETALLPYAVLPGGQTMKDVPFNEHFQRALPAPIIEEL